MKILMVEDDPEFASALYAVLSRHDFLVDHALNLAEAEVFATSDNYDAIILDRRLPDGDGLNLIATLRGREIQMPVLVLTARGELVDRVHGLNHGADDYLAKPFAFEELLARLRALLRRPANLQSEKIRVGRLEYDVAHTEASVEGSALDLTRRELLVLEALLRRQGRMVGRAALMEAVFSLDDDVQPNALDTQVSRLRRKLSQFDSGVTINGVRGVGYMLRETPK